MDQGVKKWGGARNNSGRKSLRTNRDLIKERIEKSVITEAEVRERFRILNEKYGLYEVLLSQAECPDMVLSHGTRTIHAEVEVKSSSFKSHGHSVLDCDIIICWVHDWVDCALPVLELSVLWQRYTEINQN